MADIWYNNFVQFARLLSEIRAIGLNAKQLKILGEEMDLALESIDEIFERAEQQWQQIKQGRKPLMVDTAYAQHLREIGDILSNCRVPKKRKSLK